MKTTTNDGRWETPSPYHILMTARRRRVREARERLAVARRTMQRDVARARGPRPNPRPVHVMRVGGVRKLTERIADFDLEGDVVNGWSDRV